jgi:hypothetical protein
MLRVVAAEEVPPNDVSVQGRLPLRRLGLKQHAA